MVTTEENGHVVEGTGNAPQTRNPQEDPAQLPVNVINGVNLQTVINGQNLYSNPQGNAITGLSGTSTTSIESLLANEAAATTTPTTTGIQTGAFIAIVAAVLLIGAFAIIRKMTND